ncbi:transmembrane GTPase fzo1 [Dendrothele bispora CBS 962.96]|uniref:Transmembrane GTPase fzo1 n=1 Tax=Dendrothele bispora (strain CBS 962.96) TaxID=1314807 RepID=A0A4S8M5R4_DENBC|nr:transmembrane GTPase fzo1 [Dendrothele bispora CBS 962.96]
MAQSYFPGRAMSPVKDFPAERQLKVEDVQEAYVEQKDRLVNAIDSTKSILENIRVFNRDEWVVRYPQFKQPTLEKRPSGRRSLSFADDPLSETEVVLKQDLSHSISLATVNEDENSSPAAAAAQEESLLSSDFHVLRLDLKLGVNGSASTAASLVSQLEKASIANLLDERIATALSHVDKLRPRVEDTSSKVLVTGDLNAGKSTFVNALLRREVMPVDQQPCTTAFCEVHDAAENNGVEEVHIINEGATYDIKDSATYTRASLSTLEDIVGDNDTTPSHQRMLKIYLGDARTPSESLLNNGVVDISLIDAPGLNRDSLKTTAVFARQEEIDVVVFVVSAENHFTLSARDFLANASKEKAYLFIVVNKFDQIKNKDKCKRLVLQQIKELSPRTYEDAEDLVHFVDSAQALQPYTANPAFDDLESSLRSFVLVKRSKSKLLPVSTYLSNLLCDVELLAGANAIVANAELEQAKKELEVVKPVLEKMKKGREGLEDKLENVEEDGVATASNKTKLMLVDALDRVGQGKLGATTSSTTSSLSLPTYPGLLNVLDYARDIRKALLSSLDLAVKLAEDEARLTTCSGVDKIRGLAEEYLPIGVERNRRVFMPEAMFSGMRRAGKDKNGKGGMMKRRQSSYHSSSSSSSFSSSSTPTVVAGGLAGLGIGLAQRPEFLETTVEDLFDLRHQFWTHFGKGHEEASLSSSSSSSGKKALVKKSEYEEDAPLTALGLMSVGLGTLTMVGGQTLGAKGLIEGVIRVSDLWGNDTARKWIAPVLGAVTLGGIVYLILELPNSVPRTVGRRVRAQILSSHGSNGGGGGEEEEEGFVEAHVVRIGKETRKVLRLASWDLKSRFNNALEERAGEVRSREEMEKKAGNAHRYFGGVSEKTREIRGMLVVENVVVEGVEV